MTQSAAAQLGTQATTNSNRGFPRHSTLRALSHFLRSQFIYRSARTFIRILVYTLISVLF